MRWPGMTPSFKDHGIVYHTFIPTDREHFYRHGRRSIRTGLLYAVSCLRIFGYKFDVIVVNMFPFLHLPALKLYCKLTGCKLIIDVAEVWTRDYWTKYIHSTFFGNVAYILSTYFFRSADFYICNPGITKDRLISEGIGNKHIEVFSPVLDDAALAGIKNTTKKEKQVIFIGRLIKEKRVHLFLEVFEKARKLVPGIRAVIVGDGPEKKAIALEIRKRRLGNSVELKPFFEKKTDMYREAARSSVFLQTSSREGLSTSTLESIALGTPVIVPDDTPLPPEVKRLCNVTSAGGMPGLIKKIVTSKNKQSFIKNREGLQQFYASRVGDFYREAFERMGLFE
jgi:glycosyltransferase involved in cell wall biosynthesis